MSRFYRESTPPPGANIETRNPRLYGSRDEQIEGFAERSRGIPNPDNATVFTRRRRDTYRPLRAPKPTAVDSTPAEHQRHVEIAQHNFDVQAGLARAARERGDEQARKYHAALARERRATLLALTGGVERREVEVDQGSAVNPMIAV